MATATMPYGILGAKSPFQAQLSGGLFAMAQMPGKPASQMAQNMAALQPQTQPADQMPPRPPRPPQAPPITGALPPEEGPSQATNNALMLGGMATMKASQPGGSLGTALGEGLAAGTSAFVATKNAEQDKRDRLEIQKQYAAYVQSLGLDPKATAGLTFMGVQAGSELLAKQGLQVPEFTTNVVDNGDSKSVVSTNKATGKSEVSYTGAAPTKEPENKPGTDLQSVMSLHYPGKTLAQLTPAERADVDARLERLGGSRATRVSLSSNPVINAGSDELGSRVVGDLMTRKAAFMDQVAPEFASIDRMATLLKDGIITGPMAELRAKVASGTGDQRAQNTLMYIQEVTARVLPIVRTLAPVTVEDVKLLQAAKGGNLYLSAANMKRLGELDKMAIAQKAAQYNTTVQRSSILRDENLAKYRQDAYVTMPDGSVPVRVGDTVHYAQWDPETQSHWYKTKNGRYVEVK